MSEINAFTTEILAFTNQIITKEDPEASQTSKKELCEKLVNDWNLLTVFSKNFILDVLTGFLIRLCTNQKIRKNS